MALSSWSEVVVFFFSSGSDGRTLGLRGRNVSNYKQSSSARLVDHVEPMRCEQFLYRVDFFYPHKDKVKGYLTWPFCDTGWFESMNQMMYAMQIWD